MIAFINDADGVPQVWVKNLAQGDPIQITTGGVPAHRPRWSPDGLWLYFCQIRPSFSLRKISASGGPGFEIAADWGWGTHNGAQVDPQGKLIAYVRQEKGRPPTTMIREIETGKETVFRPSFMQPQWSKDGKAILGTELAPSNSTGMREISICSFESGACRQLTRGRLPRWSRDGSRIYFLRDSKSEERKELWSISAEGKGENLTGELRTHPIGTFYDVSPKGEIMYVRFNPGKHELWLADLPRP